MVVPWSHEGGEEWVLGVSGVVGVSPWSVPISGGRSSAQG
jgi:hypothetical protein